MRWRRHRGATPRLDARDLAVAWQCSSLLLDYPTADLVCRVPTLRVALAALPGETTAGFTAYLDDLESTDLAVLQRDYVDTFDVTRRCALHLTYFTHGDTRRRGVALVELKQAFRRAGVELSGEDELPDFLPVILEFGACHDTDAGWRMLSDYRVGVELLRAALARRESRWLGVVDAVRATLPELDGDDEEALRRLLAQGPPQEDVGLEPYALDPRLNPRPAPFDAVTDLGATIPVGAPR